MKNRTKTWLVWTLSGMVLLGLIITATLTSKGQAEGVRSGIGPIAALTLKESENKTDWSPVIGTLTDGYSVALDDTKPLYKYLDVESLTASPALKDGTYDFYFDHLRVSDGYWTYWAAKGVDENATGDWQAIMWEILNSRTPMFYLEVNAGGSEIHLLDGLLFQAYGDSIPLRVSQDYPLATYHYGGWVTDVNDNETYINVQMTFTKTAKASLHIAPTDEWLIDGCGYLDVYIRLENVHDLYALDIALAFDPDILEVVDLIPTEVGVNIEPINSWFKAEYWVRNEADNALGIIQYTTTQLRTTEPADGAGDVARIRFRAKALAVDAPITITKVELSDRDAFLVGRPVEIEDPAAEITTTFSTSAGLDLDIIRYNAAEVQLQWPPQVLDPDADYVLYRSKLPYFDIEAPGAVFDTITTGFDESGTLVTYNDPVLGNVVYNAFYALQVVCSNGFESPTSWQVGKFEYKFFETASTDFNWIGYVLETKPALITASDLAVHIENNSNSDLKVLSVSAWNPSGQQFSLFVPDDPDSTFNFPVNLRFPYRVEVDVINDASTIWAQVGKLPLIEDKTYRLHQTATTDFNWILQPLDMTGINAVDDLAAHIEANALPGVSILTISQWNPSAQQFETFFGDDSNSIFTTRFGYPYRVEASINTGNEALWP